MLFMLYIYNQLSRQITKCNLTGLMQSGVFKLDQLNYMCFYSYVRDLSRNRLEGEIPPLIGQLSKLYHVYGFPNTQRFA